MSKVITAAKNGYKKKLDSLLADGHSVHYRDEKQATALFWGACRGHPGICASLISAGADINACVTWGATPLHAAADTGHAECIKVLLKFNADINAQNNRGDAPLHLACYRGFTDIVSLLLNSGADVSLKNNQGKTPYIEADSQKHLAVLKILQPQMSKIKQKHPKVIHEIPPLPNIQYSTESIHNSLNYSSFSGSNMRNFSFLRTSGPQENEDRVGSHGEVDRLSSDMDILNFDKHFDHTCNMKGNISSNCNSKSSSNTEDMFSWGGSNSDCKKSEQCQSERKHLQLEMQRMCRSLNEQNSLIQKLREENEKLKEVASQREAERIHADTNCRQMALQFTRLTQKLACYDSGSLSDPSSSSDRSASPDQVSSPSFPFSFPKPPFVPMLPRQESRIENNAHMVNLGRTVSISQNSSHKSVLELYQEGPDWKLFDLGLIRKKVSDVWSQVPEYCVKLDQNDEGEWVLGQNYELRDTSPLNRRIGEQANGTCSLVFRIKYKNHNLILKMMTNLIDLHEHGHSQGYSLPNSLYYRFGAELIPAKLPTHRNLIQILHHYSSRTFKFQHFQPLVMPPDVDGVEMASNTLFLVTPEYPQTLKTFMENTCFNSSLETFILQQLYQLLSVVYLLEKNHVVHRDIKPDNIFLDSMLRPILADFGFSKEVWDSDGPIPINHCEQIDAANNLAWTPEMIRWKSCVDPLINLTVEDVYKYTDSYSIGKMFFNFLGSEGQRFPDVTALQPHYTNDDLPKLPSFLSPGLRYVLQRLVLNKPSDRFTTRQAMLWIGMLLFPPSSEEVAQKLMVKYYLQAKMMTFLVLKPTIYQHQADQDLLSVEESIQQNAHLLEADFLCNITVDEFWDIYQSILQMNSYQADINNSR